MDKILFSERLANRRKECGYKTQYALAEEYNRRFPSSRKNRKEENAGNSSGILGTIKHYENANYNGSPKLDIVDNLCKILDCDVDFLLGNIECETHDIQFMHDKTGLSKKAIEQLIEWNEKTKLPHRDFYRNSILFISDLLECCGIQAAALAQNVFDCLFYRKISETENLTSKITKGIYDKYEVKRVRTSYKLMDCLEYIYAHSKNILTKEELQKRYPRTEEEKLLDEILG